MDTARIISDIEARKTRSAGIAKRIQEFSYRTSTLRHAYTKAESVLDETEKNEWAKCFLVGTIACVEGCLKLAVRDLVDGSEKARSCLDKLKFLKFDINLVIALETKRFSLGEFVSHMVSFGSVEEIDSVFSCLTSSEFLKDFKSDDQVFNELTRSPAEERSKIIGNLQEAFHRHIFVHELAAPALFLRPIYEGQAYAAILAAYHINEFLTYRYKVPG